MGWLGYSFEVKIEPGFQNGLGNSRARSLFSSFGRNLELPSLHLPLTGEGWLLRPQCWLLFPEAASTTQCYTIFLAGVKNYDRHTTYARWPWPDNSPPLRRGWADGFFSLAAFGTLGLLLSEFVGIWTHFTCGVDRKLKFSSLFTENAVYFAKVRRGSFRIPHTCLSSLQTYSLDFECSSAGYGCNSFLAFWFSVKFWPLSGLQCFWLFTN